MLAFAAERCAFLRFARLTLSRAWFDILLVVRLAKV
jgi:hypothetical protein